jgi:pyruvate dehydrogenase E2 component (dihydrolipoamide acetyltransferase)
VEAFESGYLRELLTEEGSMANALAPVAILTDAPEERYVRPREAIQEPVQQPRASNAGPAARSLARELGVDLATLEGTGPKGLIRRAEVQRFFEKKPASRCLEPDRT